MEYDKRIIRRFSALLEEMKKQKEPGEIKLSKAFEGFMIACKARKLSTHTIRDYQLTIQRFIDYLGDMYMRDVGTGQVSSFLASLPHSSKTVLNHHIGLSAFWTWALKEDYVDRHIVRLVEKPKPRKIAIEAFTEVEVRALLSELRYFPERDRSIIYLLLDTGIRASELVGLKRDDIDLENMNIKVLGKGDKERLVPFSRKTGSMLLKYLQSNEGKKPYSFSRTSLTHMFARLGKRAGVKNCHPHRFRHTFAITYLPTQRRPASGTHAVQRTGYSPAERLKTYSAGVRRLGAGE